MNQVHIGPWEEALVALLQAPAQVAATLAEMLTNRTRDQCRIPPPCWEPQPAGTCRLAIPPGCQGTVRIHVTNCDWTRHVVVARALGRIAGWIAFDPTTLVVDPQSEGTIVVSVRIPGTVELGQTIVGPVLLFGCNDHFVRLEIDVSEWATQTCCEARVRDCPDHVHHWYDHFYCPRPCKHGDYGKVARG